VRITGQLIDALSGTHLWADRFDGSLEDVFELQDKVAVSVAGVIEPTLQTAETARSVNRPTNDLTAYDLYLRAYATYHSSRNRIPDALWILDQAIERDPHYGLARACAALLLAQLCVDGRSKDPEADRLRGTDLARQALSGARDDPSTLAYAAMALAYFGEDIATSMTLIDRALALNPSFSLGWYFSGALRLWAGRPDTAIEHVEKSSRLAPRSVRSSNLIGAAHLVSRRFNEAIPQLLLAIQEDPNYPTPYRNLAACYAHMGRLDEAREVVARLRGITPIVVPNANYFRNPDHRETFLSGLRMASGEDT
jgi:tetratricopeptide (TPR) repeat protein